MLTGLILGAVVDGPIIANETCAMWSLFWLQHEAVSYRETELCRSRTVFSAVLNARLIFNKYYAQFHHSLHLHHKLQQVASEFPRFCFEKKGIVHTMVGLLINMEITKQYNNTTNTGRHLKINVALDGEGSRLANLEYTSSNLRGRNAESVHTLKIYVHITGEIISICV